MAVTKRTRFEVLRRDEHTCQYCGEKAPNVTLQIDHVVPVALGGDDKPSNLVTAYKDCNAGKSSIPPDSPIVNGLSERAAAYALGMVDKMTRFRADIERGDEYVDLFDEEWGGWKLQGTDRLVPLPPDYALSLHRWAQMGIPFRVIELAIPKAMAKPGLRGDDAVFNYLAGIVWSMVNAREIDYSVTLESAAVFTKQEADEHAEHQASIGYQAGRKRGLLEAREIEIENDILAHHIDNSFPFGELNPFTKTWEFRGVKLVGTRQSEHSDGHLE